MYRQTVCIHFTTIYPRVCQNFEGPRALGVEFTEFIPDKAVRPPPKNGLLSMMLKCTWCFGEYKNTPLWPLSQIHSDSEQQGLLVFCLWLKKCLR